MALVLLTQYFDTLRDVGTRGGTNTLFLPNNPGAAADFQMQIIAGLRSNIKPADAAIAAALNAQQMQQHPTSVTAPQPAPPNPPDPASTGN